MKTFSLPGARTMPAICAALIAMLALSLPGFAAPGLFMKLDGAASWSVLTGISTGVNAPTAAGAPSISEIVVTKTMDSTSPLFLKACGAGTRLARATLAWRDEAGAIFRVKLENVMVTSFSTSASDGAGIPLVEECRLTFEVMEWSWFGENGAETELGGLGVRLDLVAQQAVERSYLPFRVVVDPVPGQPQKLKITCPVERGRTYRISSSATLNGQWEKLEDFTADEDGHMERLLNAASRRLFLRVEALD